VVGNGAAYAFNSVKGLDIVSEVFVKHGAQSSEKCEEKPVGETQAIFVRKLKRMGFERPVQRQILRSRHLPVKA
jgi:hypothetical protein